MRTLILGLTVTALAAGQVLPITASLVDQAGVSSRLLQAAENDTVSLFSTGRLALRWVSLADSPDFIFVVEPDAHSAAHGTLGRTLRGEAHTSFYSYIYFDHVVYVVQKTGHSVVQLFSAAIVHELGHLLGLSHSAHGIMAAKWTVPELALVARGDLRFNDSQTNQLAAEIALRRMLQQQRPGALNLAANRFPTKSAARLPAE